MRKFAFLTWIIGLALLFSCDEDKNEPVAMTPFNEPVSGVKVYTTADANYVCEEAEENSLIFSNSTPAEVLPQVGTIIQMPVSENTPYGFLGRVTSVQNGEKIVVTTEDVALDEVYPNLSIDTSFNMLDGIIGVFDEDGNPVEYTIEQNAQSRSAGELDLEEAQINIPIPTDFLGEDFSAQGSLKASFAGSKFDIDNKDGLKYLNLEIHPSFTLSASITTKIKGGIKEFKTKPFKLKARAVVGPVIIPITIPISFKAGIQGEFTSTIQLNYSKACNAYVRYKNEEWSYGCDPITTGDESPWVVSSFDVNGSLYAGLDVEVIAGIYTRNAGIGFELFPNAKLSANASLSSINPFNVNPKVTFGIGMESRVFCMAKLFSKKLELFDIKLPDVTFFRRSVSMFPSISEFQAIGSSTSADISYITDSYYFLKALGVKTGTTVFKQDKTTEVSTTYPASNRTDRLGNIYYNTNVSDLQAGSTYYAAPVISWLNFKWIGEKQAFTTEAGYRVMWRCEGREDIWSIDININSTTTTINLPFEAATYNDGWTKRLMMATYDPATGILTGTVETNFYNNSGDRRIDGFTADLKKDDTGYMTNSKVLDNGACYTQIRFVKLGNNGARIMDLPLGEDECGLGEFLTR